MRAARLARVLWFTWAIIVWFVVFDRVIVVAGRAYIVAAEAAARTAGPYVRMDDWMRPARVRAFWTATVAAGIILGIGLTAVRKASSSTPAISKDI
jgi:hypothetical protein